MPSASRQRAATRPTKRSVMSKLPALVAVTACWLLGLTLLWQAPAGTSSSARASVSPSSASAKFVTRPIADIRVGHRVLAHNPELGPGTRPALQINPAEWRQIALRVHKPDGTTLNVSYLRRADWLAENKAEVGRQIHLVLPELNIDGPAKVLSIAACPEIESGPGRLVTATFRHSSGDLFSVSVEGLDEPIGTTGNHPFWSEDRKSFVRAEDLYAGENLTTAASESRRVRSVTRQTEFAPVFNLEVEAEHVYYVSRAGILVHNSGIMYVAPPAPSTQTTLTGAAGRAHITVGTGSGAVHGTKVHTNFETEVHALGNANLQTEVSYLNGQVVRRGTPGSVRLDVVDGPTTAPNTVYDLKTGSAKLIPSRIQQIQNHIPGGANVPVIEIR